MVPDPYANKAQQRTLQRRIKAWREEKAKDLILGQMRRATSSAEPEARCKEKSPTTLGRAPRARLILDATKQDIRGLKWSMAPVYLRNAAKAPQQNLERR
jgi:hypothetical protein